ncbi:MAG: InlB B-repeat-containing protein [Coriobacteriia bacterium]|nr:InlB B-repeat-containing protein [Coriobacteriia bacterium]
MKRSISTPASALADGRSGGMLRLVFVLMLCLMAGLACSGLSSCGNGQASAQADAPAAQEEPAEYPLVYKLRGGKLSADVPESLAKGQTLDVSELPEPTRKGYKFQGWYTDGSYKTEATQLVGEKSSKHRVLVAKWKMEQYSIRYVTLGGVLPDDVRTKYSVKTKDFKFEEPTRARFEFQGWYKDASYTKKVSGLAHGSTGDRTYYAKWKLIPGDEYFFAQNDKSSDWWDLPYWGQRIGGKGCGLVSYTMAIDVLTGANLTPADMHALRGGEKGGWNGSDGTPRSKKGSNLTHKEWSEQNFGVTMRVTESYPSNEKLAAGLDAGHVYLVSRGGNKCFKDAAGTWHYHAGHYVLLYRHDPKTNTFYIHDPSGNTVQQQRLNQAVPYSASDMRRCVKSRGFQITEMWVKEGMDPTAEDLALYEAALADEKAAGKDQ